MYYSPYSKNLYPVRCILIVMIIITALSFTLKTHDQIKKSTKCAVMVELPVLERVLNYLQDNYYYVLSNVPFGQTLIFKNWAGHN